LCTRTSTESNDSNVDKENKKYYTPTHPNTTNQFYNLSQVQKELDFGGNKTSHKFNNLNALFSPHGQPPSITYINPQPSSTKALSFVNAIKSPTAIKYETKLKENKFSVNNTDKEIFDHKINIENILIGKDKRTTIMLRNIPNKYTLQNLVDEIVNNNPTFGGKFDYINLPIDYEVNKT
jgi:hypothetical protein